MGWANNPAVKAMVQQAIDAGLPLRWHRYVDDPTLQALYAAADLSVYPSLQESFGLPVLESLWLGTPCLCTPVPSLAGVEVAMGCEFLRGLDRRALAAALNRLVRWPSLLRQRRDELSRMTLRCWSDYVDQL